MYRNHMSGVMASAIIFSAIYCGFELRSDQPKGFKIDIFCFSARARNIKEKEQRPSWLRIGIMCPNGTECLSTDGCFSELAL